MNESKQTKSRNITFRLTNKQYEQVENAALAAGEEPNSWCRKVALIQLTEGFGLTKNDRLLYEEIARRLPNAAVQASGGVSLIADLKRLPTDGAIIGKALWEGRISLEEALGRARA